MIKLTLLIQMNSGRSPRTVRLWKKHKHGLQEEKGNKTNKNHQNCRKGSRYSVVSKQKERERAFAEEKDTRFI